VTNELFSAQPPQRLLGVTGQMVSKDFAVELTAASSARIVGPRRLGRVTMVTIT
jgi:hypothetical protein